MRLSYFKRVSKLLENCKIVKVVYGCMIKSHFWGESKMKYGISK
jgi:hypothetical protein